MSDQEASINRSETKTQALTGRSFTRFLLFPRKQLKYAYFHFLLIAISVLIINLVAYHKFATLVTNTTNNQMNEMLSEYTLSVSLVTLITLVVMGAFTFVIEIVFLHRFVGPLLPLIRHLNALLDGNTTYRTKLREGDEIQELADKLNQVSAMLDSKKVG
jgi:signal transduction histidine kinase